MDAKYRDKIDPLIEACEKDAQLLRREAAFQARLSSSAVATELGTAHLFTAIADCHTRTAEALETLGAVLQRLVTEDADAMADTDADEAPSTVPDLAVIW